MFKSPSSICRPFLATAMLMSISHQCYCQNTPFGPCPGATTAASQACGEAAQAAADLLYDYLQDQLDSLEDAFLEIENPTPEEIQQSNDDADALIELGDTLGDAIKVAQDLCLDAANGLCPPPEMFASYEVQHDMDLPVDAFTTLAPEVCSRSGRVEGVGKLLDKTGFGSRMKVFHEGKQIIGSCLFVDLRPSIYLVA